MQAVQTRRVDLVALADHQHVGELHLVAKQLHQPARIVRAGLLAELGQRGRRAEILEKTAAVHHRHHGVEPGDIRQAETIGIAHRKGGRHRHRLGDAGGFDQQIVVAALAGQALHFLQQVVAQRAADAAIAEFHQRLVGAPQRRPTLA